MIELSVNVLYTGKECFQNETTILWFKIKCEVYGVVHSGGEEYVVDCDNVRIDHNESLRQLLVEVCKLVQGKYTCETLPNKHLIEWVK